MKKIILPILAASAALWATGVQANEILVYKFTRGRTWTQYQTSTSSSTSTSTLKGRAVLSGVTTERSYWIIDRTDMTVTEIRYGNMYVGAEKAKVYHVYPPEPYKELGLEAADYTVGNEFMDTMLMATNKAGQKRLTMRQSTNAASVWDLVGTTSYLKLSPIIIFEDVASSLNGLYQGTESLSEWSDESPTSHLISYFFNVATAKQTAVLDRKLTIQTNIMKRGALAAGTVNNATARVAALLEAIGYDEEQSWYGY